MGIFKESAKITAGFIGANYRARRSEIRMGRKIMFKILVLILLLAISSLQSNANDLLNLSGQVRKVDLLKEDSKSVRVKIELDLTLQNISESNLIIYKSDFSILNLILFKSDINGKQLFLYSTGGTASNFDSPETKISQKQLNKKIPPPNLTYVIKGGDSINFSIQTECVFLKSKNPSSANESWSEISKSSPVFIELTVEMFPSHLRKKNKTKSFDKVLQENWKEFGYLWLEDIISKPIQLDLNSRADKD